MTDLDVAGRALETRYGLASVVGGRHPGWGTANRIVPLGDAYIELVTVVDRREADTSDFGRWVGAAEPGRPLGWAVRTRRIDEVAARLGLTVEAGARVAQDGRHLSWRLAGVARAAAEPQLPFWIQWGPDTALPGTARVGGPAPATRVAGLELTGDARALDEWLGPHELPVSVRRGTPAVAALQLRRAGEDMTLDLV